MPDGGSLTDQRHVGFAKVVLELLRRGDPETLAYVQLHDLLTDAEAEALICALMRSLPVDVAVQAAKHAVQFFPGVDAQVNDEAYPGEAAVWAAFWVDQLGTKPRQEVAKAIFRKMDAKTRARFQKWQQEGGK